MTTQPPHRPGPAEGALKIDRRNADTELDEAGIDSIVKFLYPGSVDLWRKKNKKNLKRRSCGPSYGWAIRGETFRHSHPIAVRDPLPARRDGEESPPGAPCLVISSNI